MTTDPSTVDIYVSVVVAAALKTHFLATEETRTGRNYKTLRRTVGQDTIRSQCQWAQQQTTRPR